MSRTRDSRNCGRKVGPQRSGVRREESAIWMDADEESRLLQKCPQCGYSLRGLPIEHRCPECGGSFNRAISIDEPPPPQYAILRTFAVTLTCIGCLLPIWGAMIEQGFIKGIQGRMARWGLHQDIYFWAGCSSLLAGVAVIALIVTARRARKRALVWMLILFPVASFMMYLTCDLATRARE